MGTSKEVLAAFVKILILISCGILFSGPAAAIVMTGRIPDDGCLFDIIDEKELCDHHTFGTYDGAVAAIEDWNNQYREPYLAALKAWNEECAEIASNVEAAVKYKSLGKAVVVSPEKRSVSSKGESTVWVEYGGKRARVEFESKHETTAWLKRGVTLVERILPAYELPEPPDPGEPYLMARSAYSQLHTDGLTLFEWRVLHFALCDTHYYQEMRSVPSYLRGERRPVGRLVDKGYVTVNAREKRNFWEAAAGELEPKLDFEFTAEGKEYLRGLADRCCDFREGMAAEARDSGEITAAEYKQLHKDNEYIRKAFHDQIKKRRNWDGDLPFKLEKASKSFELRGESLTTTRCPYTRVVKCIPKLKRVPDPVKPPILPAGTYTYDGRGELKAVNLD